MLPRPRDTFLLPTFHPSAFKSPIRNTFSETIYDDELIMFLFNSALWFQGFDSMAVSSGFK